MLFRDRGHIIVVLVVVMLVLLTVLILVLMVRLALHDSGPSDPPGLRAILLVQILLTGILPMVGAIILLPDI